MINLTCLPAVKMMCSHHHGVIVDVNIILATAIDVVTSCLLVGVESTTVKRRKVTDVATSSSSNGVDTTVVSLLPIFNDTLAESDTIVESQVLPMDTNFETQQVE